MAMELILKNGTVTIPQAIENIQILKQELADRLSYYKSLIVTEDGIKDAKADKANLNKLKTAIDSQRKEAKRQTMALYEPLEKECKELLSMIDEPIAAIDGQLKAFDEKKKAEKFAALVEFFEQINTLDFVKLEHVLNPKWGNVTMKLDALKDEISGTVQAIVDDYAEIKKLYADSPMLTAIVQRFETTLDKSAALAYAAEIERKEQARKAAEEARRAAEQARKEREVAEQGAMEQQMISPEKNEPTPQGPADPIVTEAPPQAEPIGRVTFAVTGTKSQIIALRDFMKQNNIVFTVVR